MDEYLKETEFLDYSNPRFDDFLLTVDPKLNQKALAIQLYELVRESFVYDPYHLDLRFDGLKASNVLTKKRAWCVEKANVLAAIARRYKIPSRLGYAIVTNHIGVEKLENVLRRKEIVFHGFVELFVEEKWVKCTPAFDQKICKLSGVSVLEWDGEHDSMFQEFEGGKAFMEYLHYYGSFSDVPIHLMNQEMKKYYPHLFEQNHSDRNFSFYHL